MDRQTNNLARDQSLGGLLTIVSIRAKNCIPIDLYSILLKYLVLPGFPLHLLKDLTQSVAHTKFPLQPDGKLCKIKTKLLLYATVTPFKFRCFYLHQRLAVYIVPQYAWIRKTLIVDLQRRTVRSMTFDWTYMYLLSLAMFSSSVKLFSVIRPRYLHLIVQYNWRLLGVTGRICHLSLGLLSIIIQYGLLILYITLTFSHNRQHNSQLVLSAQAHLVKNGPRCSKVI